MPWANGSSLSNPTTGPWLTIAGVAGSVRYDPRGLDPGLRGSTPAIGRPCLALAVAGRGAPYSRSIRCRWRSRVRAVIHQINAHPADCRPQTHGQGGLGHFGGPASEGAVHGAARGLRGARPGVGRGGDLLGDLVDGDAIHSTKIGIRMALGATPRAVMRAVMRRSMLAALGGAILGLGGAAALTNVLKAQLFGISATDPLTFALAAIVLAAVAWEAAYVPARRATRIDPMSALRA